MGTIASEEPPVSGVIVCFAKCWPCTFDQHPGGWHTWADAEDIEHAKAEGKPDPSKSKCGCPCTSQPADDGPVWDEPDHVAPEDEPEPMLCLACEGEGYVGAHRCLDCLGTGDVDPEA